MSKKTTNTTTNEPSAYSKGYITPAANALSEAYSSNQGNVQNITGLLNQGLPGVAASAFGPDAGLTAATSYNADVLGGKYLGQGNPYLADMIGKTASDTTDRVNSTFGAAGRTGSGRHTYDLAKGLADSENTLRYGDYTTERAAMAGAAGQAPALLSAKYSGIAPLIALAGTSAMLPQESAGAYASGIGGLVGQYNTGTSTAQKSFGANLQDYLVAAAAAAAKIGGG